MPEREIDEKWREMKERVTEIMKKGSEVKENNFRKGWWDKECEEGKRKVRMELRKWRRGEGLTETHRKEKSRYNHMIEDKKRKENERWKRQIQKIRRTGLGGDKKKEKKERSKRRDENGRMGKVF